MKRCQKLFHATSCTNANLANAATIRQHQVSQLTKGSQNAKRALLEMEMATAAASLAAARDTQS